MSETPALQITIFGNCPIKKNDMTHQNFRWDRVRKIKIPLPYTVSYYNERYVEWAKRAVQQLMTFKRVVKLNYPLQGSYFVSFWIWRSTRNVLEETKTKIDLSNLIEAPQDLLAGNVGNFMDTGKKKFDHSLYQILADDNCNIVTSLSTSKVFYDPVSPRTEIFLKPFDLIKFAKVHKYLFGVEPVPEIDDTPLTLFGKNN